MIIPPDPEKDSNAFSPTSSTPSLVPPPSEPSDIAHPPEAHTRDHPSFGFPFGDDLGLGYAGEALPPYQRERERLEEGDVFADPPTSQQQQPTPLMRQRSRRSVTLPPQPTLSNLVIPAQLPPHAGSPITPESEFTPIASTSASRLPYTTQDTHDQAPSSTAVDSTAKLWESSSSSSSRGKHRAHDHAWFSPASKRRWKKWRKWVYIVMCLLLAGIGVMTGVLVGIKAGERNKEPADKATPWSDLSGNGQRSTWVTTGESLNITYDPDRDGPFTYDGTIINCPVFLPLNESSPFNLLTRPFPAQSLTHTSFQFPLSKNGSAPQVLPDFTFIAHGLGSSGTVEMLGTDAPAVLTSSGKEGVMTVDVVLMYSGVQDINTIMRVCELQRVGEGLGLGVFTPLETDGRVSDAYMLNPVLLPSFHIIIRLPPSALLSPTSPSVSIPYLAYELDRMAVRFGNLENVVEFGEVSIESKRGGVNAEYLSARNVSVWTGENAVRGRWNVSEAILVNSTEGAVVAEMILHDPTMVVDNVDTSASDNGGSGNTSTTDGGVTILDPHPIVYRRKSGDEYTDRSEYAASQTSSAVESSLASPSAAPSSTSNDTAPRPTHSVTTTFATAEGMLDVSYLYQSPTTFLTALIVNGQGDISVSLHPNYIGPFVAKNIWGQVRIPPPASLLSSDPKGWSRQRAWTIGPIDIPAGGLYDSQCLNTSLLQDSAMAISGAAYWRGEDGSLSPQAVQESDEGGGGEVLIMGAWGDLRLTVDGM